MPNQHSYLRRPFKSRSVAKEMKNLKLQCYCANRRINQKLQDLMKIKKLKEKSKETKVLNKEIEGTNK